MQCCFKKNSHGGLNTHANACHVQLGPQVQLKSFSFFVVSFLQLTAGPWFSMTAMHAEIGDGNMIMTFQTWWPQCSASLALHPLLPGLPRSTDPPCVLQSQWPMWLDQGQMRVSSVPKSWSYPDTVTLPTSVLGDCFLLAHLSSCFYQADWIWLGSILRTMFQVFLVAV